MASQCPESARPGLSAQAPSSQAQASAPVVVLAAEPVAAQVAERGLGTAVVPVAAQVYDAVRAVQSVAQAPDSPQAQWVPVHPRRARQRQSPLLIQTVA